VTDVFALDVITEMLQSPLQFLSYLNLRSRFSDKLLVSNELTILSYHLRRNLWLDDRCDMVALDESFAGPLDIAMAARRDHVPGASTPDGILTRYQNLTIGQILTELDHQDDPLAVDLGLLLLQLSEKALKTRSKGIDKVVARTRRDGNTHDISMGFGSPFNGLTIHCNARSDSEATERLRLHCEVRKHASKSDSWFGLIVRPQDGSIRVVSKVEHPWRPNEQMDEAVRQFQSAARNNAGKERQKARPSRNDRCPCGSGEKYKRCCLQLV
jgi:hypothetical protein